MVPSAQRRDASAARSIITDSTSANRGLSALSRGGGTGALSPGHVKALPALGVGVGLRRAHFDSLPVTERRVDWLEFTPENYMAFGGRPLQALDACRERWPLVAHSVNMNLGGTAPLDRGYLESLRTILDRVESPWFSDHLCWSAVPGRNTHELLPLPFTLEAVDHVVARIKAVRDFIGRPILVENISAYIRWPGEMSEAEFTAEVLERADCGLLLDINNIYVNSCNHGEDPWAFLNNIPLDRVVQVHMAGHDDSGPVLIDTHGAPVIRPVWDLYRTVLPRLPRHSILIEWDMDVPPLDTLLDEADRARAILWEAVPGLQLTLEEGSMPGRKEGSWPVLEEGSMPAREGTPQPVSEGGLHAAR